MSTPLPPAPDWYADPFTPGRARWWDGRAWTGFTAPLAPDATAARSASPAGVRPPPPVSARGERRPPLDVATERMRTDDPVSWGARPILIPLVTIVALIAASIALTDVALPSSRTPRLIFAAALTFGLDGLLVLAVWLGGRAAASRNDGWARTFGWRRPRWSDLKWAAIGIGVTFGARIVVGGIANGLTHGRAGKEAQNIQIDHISVLGLIVLSLVVVVWAPLIEELLFRGLLLRTFMRRLSFWPSAAISTAIFAILHTYEVDTLAGAITLAASVATLGLANCWLNRMADSLVPGIIVHATFNALAVVYIAVQAS